MSSSLIRVLRNAWRVGPKGYWKQLNRIGDTKAGTLVGTDVYGNQYFENDTEDEIHLRTRWVEYKEFYGDMSQVEPGWHYWLAYGTDIAPNKLPQELKSTVAVPPPKVYENLTGTRGSYMCYNTVKPKYSPWMPRVIERN